MSKKNPTEAQIFKAVLRGDPIYFKSTGKQLGRPCVSTGSSKEPLFMLRDYDLSNIVLFKADEVTLEKPVERPWGISLDLAIELYKNRGMVEIRGIFGTHRVDGIKTIPFGAASPSILVAGGVWSPLTKVRVPE